MNKHPARPNGQPNDDISVLVRRLLETEQQLMDLTGGSVDAVIRPTGQSYLLQSAQEKLKQSEAEFRTLAEAMPQIIWVTRPDGWTTYFSQQWMNYTGLTLAESLGHGWNKPFHPADQQRAWEAWQHATATTSNYSIECRLRRADGEYRWWLVRGAPLKDAKGNILKWIGTCTDINDIKQTHSALQESENRFRSMFNSAATGIAICTPRGAYLQANEAFCRMLGYSEDELRARDFKSVTHADDLTRNHKLLDELLAGQRPSYVMEKRYLKKNGDIVWTSQSVSAVHAANGEISMLIIVSEDITERKRLEDHFRQAQKLDALGTLAGGIAHDFNNILAAINGYNELSRMKLKDNPEVRQHLGAVSVATKRAIHLVRQILAFSRQEQSERLPIKLRPVVVECVELLRATIPSTIDFDLLLSPDAPMVLADATQIHQILTNLGTNAVHAMKDGPGLLQIKLERCVVDAAHAATQRKLRPGVYARISVSDTGRGMDKETLRRIFEPFFTTKQPGEGTGLGLSVVHGIMESYEGAITVYSQLGEGTAFHLYFPEHAGEAEQVATEETPVPRGHGERILFVDDEELLVQLGQQTLTELGYEVEVAILPSIALARVREDPARFALVISDQTMPGMTGLMLAARLQLIRPTLPIILTTGYSLTLTPERIEEAGIFRLLPKPASIHALGTAVHDALASQRSH